MLLPVISFSSLFLFSLLLDIFSLLTFISEFILSILFSLSNPSVWSLSISEEISSIWFFKSCFNSCISSSLLFSSRLWFSKISLFFSNSWSFSLNVFIFNTNKPTSMFFNSSLKSKNFLAFSDCNLSGSIFASISDRISLILTRFSFVCSSFFSDSSLLVLYFTIPEASSNIFLLSSDLLLKISSIFPCPIIE